MHLLIGLINWLSISTRPDIVTITNLLAKYMATPSKGHIEAAKRVLCYLKWTQHHGIAFHSNTNNIIQPLKTLQSNLLFTSFQKFINQLGVTPKLIRTDFDSKLISGIARTYLDAKNIKIQAAPPKRQDQNGLVERHWWNVVNMTSTWMRWALLPSEYWWFVIQGACEVKNILPATHIPNIITTPFKLAHNKKSRLQATLPPSGHGIHIICTWRREG